MAARFRAIPHVGAVEQDGERYTIRGAGDDLVTAVIRCLSDERIPVTAFRTVISALAGRGGARIDFVDVDRRR